jgi:hypothetical protein
VAATARWRRRNRRQPIPRLRELAPPTPNGIGVSRFHQLPMESASADSTRPTLVGSRCARSGSRGGWPGRKLPDRRRPSTHLGVCGSPGGKLPDEPPARLDLAVCVRVSRKRPCVPGRRVEPGVCVHLGPLDQAHATDQMNIGMRRVTLTERSEVLSESRRSRRSPPCGYHERQELPTSLVAAIFSLRPRRDTPPLSPSGDRWPSDLHTAPPCATRSISRRERT